MSLAEGGGSARSDIIVSAKPMTNDDCRMTKEQPAFTQLRRGGRNPNDEKPGCDRVLVIVYHAIAWRMPEHSSLVRHSSFTALSVK